MRSNILTFTLCILASATATNRAFGYGAGTSNPQEGACRRILELEGIQLASVRLPDPKDLRADYRRLASEFEASRKAVAGERRNQEKLLKEFYADLKSDGALDELYEPKRDVASINGEEPQREDPRILIKIKYDEAFHYHHYRSRKHRWSVNQEDLSAFTRLGSVFLKRTHDYDREHDILRLCTQSEGILTFRSCSVIGLKSGKLSTSASADLGAEKRWIRSGKLVSSEEYVRRRWQETFEHGLPVESGKATRLSERCKPYLAHLLTAERR